MCEAGTHTDGSKITAVAGQYSINPAALGYGSDGAVDESEVETLKSGIELQRPGNVVWKGRFVFVTCGRIKDLGDEFAHRFALRTQEIIHFREDKSGYDDGSSRSQDSLVFRKARLAGRRAGECAQQAARVSNNGRDQSSMSRKSSDSSPSLLLVDSNRSVEGGRRPE